MNQRFQRMSDTPYGKILVHTLNVIIPAAIVSLVGIGYNTRINSSDIDHLKFSQGIQDKTISRMYDKLQDLELYNSAATRDFDYLQKKIEECKADLKSLKGKN